MSNSPIPSAPDDVHLDVAFSSDTTANDPTQPIAMAYGYTDDSLGSFQGKGQTKETMQPNSKVSFFVFDTAASSNYNVSSVTVTSVNKQPGAGKPCSPFSDTVWSTGTIVATGGSTGSNVAPLNGPGPSTSQSTGCNIKGRNWWFGPFTVGSFAGIQRFELTVTVLTKDGQQNSKTFSVDPEMVVDGSNK